MQAIQFVAMTPGRRAAQVSLAQAIGAEVYTDQQGSVWAVKDSFEGVPHRREGVIHIEKVPAGWTPVE